MDKPVENLEDIKNELRALALARPVECFDFAEGRLELRPLGEMPAATAAAISQVERGPNGVKVRFYDKLKAIGMLMRLEGVAPPEDNNLLEILAEGSQNDEEEWLDENGVSVEA